MSKKQIPMEDTAPKEPEFFDASQADDTVASAIAAESHQQQRTISPTPKDNNRNRKSLTGDWIKVKLTFCDGATKKTSWVIFYTNHDLEENLANLSEKHFGTKVSEDWIIEAKDKERSTIIDTLALDKNGEYNLVKPNTGAALGGEMAKGTSATMESYPSYTSFTLLKLLLCYIVLLSLLA